MKKLILGETTKKKAHNRENRLRGKRNLRKQSIRKEIPEETANKVRH